MLIKKNVSEIPQYFIFPNKSEFLKLNIKVAIVNGDLFLFKAYPTFIFTGYNIVLCNCFIILHIVKKKNKIFYYS